MNVSGELLFNLADSVEVGFMIEVVFVGGRRERNARQAVSQSGAELARLIQEEERRGILVRNFLHTVVCGCVNRVPSPPTSRLVFRRQYCLSGSGMA